MIQIKCFPDEHLSVILEKETSIIRSVSEVSLQYKACIITCCVFGDCLLLVCPVTNNSALLQPY